MKTALLCTFSYLIYFSIFGHTVFVPQCSIFFNIPLLLQKLKASDLRTHNKEKLESGKHVERTFRMQWLRWDRWSSRGSGWSWGTGIWGTALRRSRCRSWRASRTLQGGPGITLKYCPMAKDCPTTADVISIASQTSCYTHWKSRIAYWKSAN